MRLTEDEQRRLRQIERALTRQDPGLARRLSSRPALLVDPRRAALTAVLGSLAALGVGALLQLPVLCVTGWIGLLCGGFVFCVTARVAPTADTGE